MGKNKKAIFNPLTFYILGITVLLSFARVSFAAAASEPSEIWRTVLDLRGQWKFELGDDEKRSSVDFNDSKWEEIFAPSPWEDEGYPGYDGYAWYRKHFRLPAGAEKKVLFLRLGCIDDVAEIYFNGVLIGISGSFPPDFNTAYNTEIVLPVPRNALNLSGDNVIAVCVYDDQMAGGIVQGKIGLYEAKDYLAPEIILTGKWQFKKGDSEKWSDPSLDDRSWDQIFVPAFWEAQGYPKYDGMGWYRLHFKVPAELARETLVLLLGRIDDLDQTYVNGEEIGHTGKIKSDPWKSHHDKEYRELRAYTIPGGLLKSGADNIIAVRVYDGGGWGGIYEGPIGIMTRDRYRQWRNHRPWKDDLKESPWKIFERIFD
jgi:hypothetical protein